MPLSSTRGASATHRVAGLVLALALALPAARAGAIVSDTPPRGTIALPVAAMPGLASGEPARALEAAPAWQAFRGRHGDWSASWNDATGSPHRAVGPAIPLPGFAGDSASIDAALRAFVASNPGLFGAGTTIAPRSIRRHGRLWYASYRQLIGGLEVLFADWEFRVSAEGRLMLFGADAWPVTAPPRAIPIARAATDAAAIAGLDFTPGRDAVEALGPAALLPLATAGGLSARTVLPVRVRTLRPLTNWLTLVDASTGEVLMREDQVRHLTGRVTGLVHPRTPTDPLTPRRFAHQVVTTATDTVVTDTAGVYVLPGAGVTPVTAELRGSFVDVRRDDVDPPGSGDAHFSGLTSPGGTLDIAWGDAGYSHDAERDAYYHGNVAHDHLKQLDSLATLLDYPMPFDVNYPYANCNAVWTGLGIYLFVAGSGCVNSATAGSVIYHEYGHAVNDAVYVGDGITMGMMNGSLQEGTADLNAAFITDEPRIGSGFFGPGTWVRNLETTLRWPDDEVSDPHVNGLMLAGAFWDLRKVLGLAATERLSHQAKHGHPDDPHDGIAFSEMFLETLVADDDDGDLANGTPHAATICAAFSAHGIGPNYWISIAHTPVVDPPAGGAVPVVATMRYTGPGFTAFDPASPTLHYALGRGPFIAIPMIPTGAADQFTASIPAPPGAVVAYYLTARDGLGDEQSFPASSPRQRVLRFLAGPAVPALAWDMSVDPGWSVGAPDDNATAGLWVRENPMQSANTDTANLVVSQPADDHTPGDTICWVTGNADTMYVPGYNDVDGGKITLTTSVFDALPDGYEHPVIEYWRWYSNNTGSNVGGDAWRVDVSNDGGATWVPLENTTETARSWERVLARIEDYVTPTHTMRVRFVANDDPPTSIVEALVDDFRLLAFPVGTVSAGGDAPGPALEFLAPSPNPSRGEATLRLRLPAAALVRIELFDVGGRHVRALADATLGAGEHALAWDGRDDAGHAVPGGLYLARLDAGGKALVRRIVRVR